MSEEILYHSAETLEGPKDSKTDAGGEFITRQDIERARGHLSRFKPLSLNQEGETQYQGLLHELIALEQELNDSNIRETGLQEMKHSFESGKASQCTWMPKDSFIDLPEDVKQRNEMIRQMMITITQIGLEIGVSFNSITSALASIIDYGQKEATDTWDKVTLGLSVIPFIGATVRQFNGFRKLEKAGEEALTTGRTASHQRVVERANDLPISDQIDNRITQLLQQEKLNPNELINIVNDMGGHAMDVASNFNDKSIGELERFVRFCERVLPSMRNLHKDMIRRDIKDVVIKLNYHKDKEGVSLLLTKLEELNNKL